MSGSNQSISSDNEDAVEVSRQLEAVIFASRNPVPLQKLKSIVKKNSKEIEDALKKLNSFYEETKRAFKIYFVAGGYQIRTLPEFNQSVKMSDDIRVRQLSVASLETLSIIAYRQPATRAYVESLRTVDCGYSLKSLLDKGFIMIKGRERTLPGHPLLYTTTSYFLEVFGLETLDDLPRPGELNLPDGLLGEAHGQLELENHEGDDGLQESESSSEFLPSSTEKEAEEQGIVDADIMDPSGKDS